MKNFLIRILSCFIPIKKQRKYFRNKFIKIKDKNKLVEEDNSNNVFVLIKEGNTKIYYPDIDGLNITFLGKNNRCFIYEPITEFVNCNICFVGNNGYFEIKGINNHNFKITNLNIRIGSDNKIIVGNNFSCNGANINVDVETDIKLYIGNDVMFSYGIEIRTTDAHCIIDTEGHPINHAKDIIIGNHVWIAQNVFLSKGAIIPDNSIVGACSFVNKAFNKTNTIIAGNPAKICKEGVNWLRCSVQKYLKDKEVTSDVN